MSYTDATPRHLDPDHARRREGLPIETQRWLRALDGLTAPAFRPVASTASGRLNRSPSLDQAAGLFPVRFGQGRPHAADRSTSSIGTLLPIALCGRSSL